MSNSITLVNDVKFTTSVRVDDEEVQDQRFGVLIFCGELGLFSVLLASFTVKVTDRCRCLWYSVCAQGSSGEWSFRELYRSGRLSE